MWYLLSWLRNSLLTLYERLKSLRKIPDIVREVWRINRPLAASSFMLRIVLATFPPATLWVSKLIIDAVVAVHSRRLASWLHVWILVSWELALVAATDVLSRVANYSDSRLSDLFSHTLNLRILEHTGKVPLEHLEGQVFQDQLECARAQISTQLAVLYGFAQLIQTNIGLIALISGIALYAPWLVGLQLGALAPLALVEMRYASILHRLHRQRAPERRMMDYLMTLTTTSRTAKEVKALDLDEHFIGEYERIGNRLNEENAHLSKQRHRTAALLTVIGTIAYYGGYVYLIWEAGRGLITVGTLFFLAGSFQRGKWAMQDISATLSRTLDQSLYLSDIFDFFIKPPLVEVSGGTRRVPHRIVTGFEFKEVSFSYPGTHELALDRVSFSVSPGETIGIVGENGAGKTTVTKLLARLYEPTEGTILLDGYDIRDYDLGSLRNAISIVFQDFVRYEMTARRNIGLGSLADCDDDELIARAAKIGMAQQIIDRLPKKYDQLLGKRFEGGIELSGGEWQKIAISRGCMRDAQLLILDEPSASLDPKKEFLLIEHFAKVISGRMAILISHRLPTVRIADKILVLQKGVLVEEGCHEDLMARGGEYASMVRLQASGYGADFGAALRNESTPTEMLDSRS